MAVHRQALHGASSAPRRLPWSLCILRFLFRRVGALLPSTMGRWACRLWFRTQRFPPSAAAARAVQAARRETMTVGKARVVLYRWGEGPVVWFVHGWSGCGSQVAALVEPLQAAGFQVLAPDLPGHGRSSGHSTTILECARVLQHLQQYAGVPEAVITHSFGGMVLAYALNHGVRTQRAVCFCPPADARFLVDSFARTLDMHTRVVSDLCRRLERRFEHNFWDNISTVSNAHRLTVPALLIHDEQDRSVPWRHSERIAAAWPGARFLKTRGLGHGRILRNAESVAAAVHFITKR